MDINERLIVQRVSDALSEGNAQGAAVAIISDGTMVYAEGVGFRDLTRTEPLPDDARFYVYSVIKTVLAAVVLQLVDAGLVELEQDVRTYLPELPIDAVVTVRQVLNHTGGLPDYGALPEYQEALRSDPGVPWTVAAFLQNTLRDGMLFEPGWGWAYSNIGYMIVRMLVERVTGGSLRDIFDERIVRPLGLRRTFVAESLADAEVLTPGYSTYLRQQESAEDIAPRYHPGWVSHGVVVSTAGELALAVDAIITGRFFSPECLAEMLEPTFVPGEHPLFRQTAYGLGVMLDPKSPYGLAAGHGGDGPGYSIGAMHFADVAGSRVTAVALVNSDVGELGLPIAFGLADALAGDPR